MRSGGWIGLVAQKRVAVPPASSVIARLTAAPADAQEETWTLSCETPEGTTRSARQVFVARGERRTLDLRGDCQIRR